MNYLDDVEKELRRIIETTPQGRRTDAVVTFVKEKLIESFKNGLEAGKQRPDRRRGTNRTTTTATKQ